MPKYKHGKIKESLTFEEIESKVSEAQKKLDIEATAFFWLLYYSGCRNSELYERVIEDCSITETHFVIDFGKRKKGGEAVPPLAFPLAFPGIETVIKHFNQVKIKKPKRKLIERTAKGIRTAIRKKAKWLFPNIHRTWASIIVKTVLGKEYYPHFLRLNRITELCSDPDFSLTRLKSFTGLKSLDALQSYLGVSKKEQKAAIDFIGKQINKKD